MEEYSVSIDIEDITEPEETDYFQFDFVEGVYPKARVPWGQVSDWMRARAELTEDKQKK